MKLYWLLALVPLTVNAAVWERPSGGYTPSNHSVNTTKYQDDSTSGRAISSQKIDGDINKAYQGLNDLEARVPPSMSGNSGKFLTTDGSAASWNYISSTSISNTGPTAGLVLQATGTGGAGWGTISPSALGNSGVSAGTYAFPQLTINASGLVTSATTPTTAFISGSALVVGTISVTNVSASTVTATAINGAALTSGSLIKAWATFSGSTAGAFTPSASFNIASANRVGTGTYQFTFPAGVFNNFAACTGVGTEGTNNYPIGPVSVGTTTSQTLVPITNGGGGRINVTIGTIHCVGN